MGCRELYSESFIEKTYADWNSREDVNNLESFLLSKYLKNNALSVLEAGTGSGVISFFIEEKLKFKDITAFDIIPEMIDRANERSKQKESEIEFITDDASKLENLKLKHYDYLVYLQQILSIVPEERLDLALNNAYKVGNDESTYIFSFMDWNSRWYNPILSFNVNFFRLVTGRKIQKYYLPQLKFNGKLNKRFFKKDQQGIFWGKKEKIISKLHKAGFKIDSFYKESEITNATGTTFYFLCKK